MCAQYFKSQSSQYPIFQLVYDGLVRDGFTFPDGKR